MADYTTTNQDGYAYPDHYIDPEKKDYDWIKRYAQAAFSNGRSYIPSTMMYFGRTRMAEISDYKMGKQSVSKYKKLLAGDETTDRSWLDIDWNPVALLPKYREIAISKILQQEYETEAFAIDPLAKSEEDGYFNQMKVKIMMREAAQKVNPQYAELPALQQQQGEPADLEELKIQQKYSYKHQRALETELAISLIKFQNEFEEKRKRTVENLYDFGIGGYKDWNDPNGMVKFDEVTPDSLITSYCIKNDFSDMVHAGMVRYISVVDLVPYFNEDQLKFICEKVAGTYGNPNSVPMVNTYGRIWDKFKVAVFDLEFFSWNTTVYKKEIDSRGNLRTYKTDYANGSRTDATIEFFKGQAEPKYLKSNRKVVYRCKWIIGTDFMYDYGLSPNQKRKSSSWWDTTLSYNIYAWNFYNMKFTGITERLIPIEDQLCLIWFKIQNLMNKLIPYLIKLDINALEGVNFGKGGKKMSPADLVDFMLQQFTVLYRSTDLLSKNPNYDPARIEATGQVTSLVALGNEFKEKIALMQQVSGLNDFTDGSTPPQKTLVPGIESAIQSTNNALYPIMRADKWLTNKLADAIVQRVQIAVKLGKVEGYAKALGDDSVRFLQISPDISNYEFGIFTREAITQEERAAFLQELNLKDSQGLVDPAMKIIIMSCRNLKQAAELLAYHVEQQRDRVHQQQMQLVQQQNDGNTQSALMIEQAKQQTLEMQHKFTMEEISAKGQWDYMIEMGKKESDREEGKVQAEAKVLASHIQAQAKKDAQGGKAA